MKMNRILKVIVILWTVASMLMLLVGYMFLEDAKTKNRLLDSKFNLKEDAQYGAGIPIEEIDFSLYTDANIFDKKPGTGSLKEDSITSAITLRYYAAPDESSEVVYEIPAGTKVVFSNKHMEIGYGIYSFPTYEEGWRYVRPYTVENGSIVYEEDSISDQYYYVKTADMREYVGYLIKLCGLKNAESNARKYLFATDTALYNKGFYFSPDLYHDVMTPTSVTGFTWGAIFLGAEILFAIVWNILKVRKKKVSA